MASKFEPKEPVQLDPPKSDLISQEFLAKCNGVDSDLCYVAIKGKVFNVTGKAPYQPGGSYHAHTVFTGKDSSRALALTSTKAEDARPEWQDLDEKEKKTLDDWMTYFSKRYNIVGVVEGATNLE